MTFSAAPSPRRQALGRLARRLVLGGELQVLERGGVQLDVLHLALEAACTSRLARLPLEHAQPRAQLAHDVAHAQEVLLGVLHLLARRLAAALVAGDAGGLSSMSERRSSAGGDDEADAALLDDGVGLGAHAGAQEQLVTSDGGGWGLVDQVLVSPLRNRRRVTLTSE
jgi:hypothetical protein